MKMVPNTVYIQAGPVRKVLFVAETEEEAYNFCTEHDWYWLDENNFEWDLDYVDDD